MNPKKKKKLKRKTAIEWKIIIWKATKNERARERQREWVRENTSFMKKLIWKIMKMGKNKKKKKVSVSILYLFSTPAIRNRDFSNAFLDFIFLQGKAKSNKKIKEESRKKKKKHSFYEFILLLFIPFSFFLLLFVRFRYFLGSGTLIEYYRSPRPF